MLRNATVSLLMLLAAALTALLALPARAMPAREAAHASLCDSGRRQSPIDITATQRGALPALQFDYRAAPLRIVHDGHTVRLRFDGASRLLIGGVPHRLQQLHFHLPGGDRIHGEEFPMALHLPHKSPSGQLVTVVVPFRAGKEHAALARLLPWLPAPHAPERVWPDERVNAAQWVPEAAGYYAYDGSLTGPPCTEGVRWIVMKTPLTASPQQLAALARAMAPNARAVQPMHGRVVSESSP